MVWLEILSHFYETTVNRVIFPEAPVVHHPSSSLQTGSYGPFSVVIYLSLMVIFYSHVQSPEGM
jgi:hypothetical protein